MIHAPGKAEYPRMALPDPVAACTMPDVPVPPATGTVLGGSMVVVLDPKQARSVFSLRPPGQLEVRLAMMFKAPRDADRLVQEEFAEMLDDGETRREDVERIVRQLTADGVLAPVAESSPRGRQARHASDAASIATLLHSIAGDLAALGDWAEDHVRHEAFEVERR